MLDPTATLLAPSDRRYEHGYDAGFKSGEAKGRATALDAMGADVEALNRSKGWYEDERSFGDEVALLHSEISEALDAYREHGFAEFTDESKAYADGIGKPDDVGSELADTLIRLLDTARRHGIDLQAEYERKMRYNATRPYRHGGKAL